ncbi:hypothetical protein Francci3_2967 [Frankia casuarinae]|uniref:Uncharacterized protein n=1 Tax=Frankia casuarinae (strain DSM 45818 / CECT 9043 / HFP020203 / CcI3) TaxID=106370 RepID=Q2J8R8_FRACC|nr:hypothetical protein Francci3_2967 [Frankia casuarinae]
MILAWVNTVRDLSLEIQHCGTVLVTASRVGSSPGWTTMLRSRERRPISRGVERWLLRRTATVAAGSCWGHGKSVQGTLFADGPGSDEGNGHVQLPSSMPMAPAGSRRSRQAAGPCSSP